MSITSSQKSFDVTCVPPEWLKSDIAPVSCPDCHSLTPKYRYCKGMYDYGNRVFYSVEAEFKCKCSKDQWCVRLVVPPVETDICKRYSARSELLREYFKQCIRKWNDRCHGGAVKQNSRWDHPVESFFNTGVIERAKRIAAMPHVFPWLDEPCVKPSKIYTSGMFPPVLIDSLMGCHKPQLRKESKNMLLIGISAKIGCGKTTLAENLKEKLTQEGHNVARMSFGQYVKDLGALIFNPAGLVNMGFGQKMSKAISKGSILPCGMEAGSMWQKFGTDFARKFDPDIWLRHMWADLRKPDSDTDVIIIDDVRFRNEFNFIRDLGGILVRLGNETDKRKGLLKKKDRRKSDHISEVDLDGMVKEFDIVISDNLPGPLSEMETAYIGLLQALKDKNFYSSVENDSIRSHFAGPTNKYFQNGRFILPDHWKHLEHGLDAVPAKPVLVA